ncbi:MAG: hypothetical protein JWN83_2829 [Chitinophagaceae bacterium]|nr:hypothetical protein [Chitinophagaceae bacterium]
MELAPRYCRSCGSRILVKNVCHNCNRDPLKGDNYCYDCGALTPNADSCLKCGARYKTSFPVKPFVVIGSLLIISVALAAYFLSRPDKTSLASQEKAITQTATMPETNKQELPQTPAAIVSNPVDSSALKNNNSTDSAIIKTPPPDSVKKSASGIFTSEELKAYKARCSYFGKNQRNQVVFFIANGSGYVKMNENIYELKRKRKGVDVAVFGNDEYEATITIDGLSGSAREWLASCTLIIKDLLQNTSAKHKVYSPCIEL